MWETMRDEAAGFGAAGMAMGQDAWSTGTACWVGESLPEEDAGVTKLDEIGGEGEEARRGHVRTKKKAPRSKAKRRKMHSGKERNPYVMAAMKLDRETGDTFEDLDDFIVCKPGRDYEEFLTNRWRRVGAEYLIAMPEGEEGEKGQIISNNQLMIVQWKGSKHA